MPRHPEPSHHADDHRGPTVPAGVALAVLLGLAVSFVSFLVAPLAVLMVFYVGFAAADRATRRSGGPDLVG